MGNILWRSYFRTVIFPNFVLFQFKALFFRPMFKPLKTPLWLKTISKPRHRLNLHILKNILMQEYFVLFEKYQLIWWFELNFRCLYFALWSCLNNHQILIMKNYQISKIHPWIFSMVPNVACHTIFFPNTWASADKSIVLYCPIIYEPRCMA